MVTVQFKTKIKNGIIQVPKKYQEKFSDDVRVILKVASGKKIKTASYLDSLMAHPVKIKKFRRLTREQIYVR